MCAHQIPGSRAALTRLVQGVALLLILAAVSCGADVRPDARSTGSVTPGATGMAARPRFDGSIPAVPGSAPGTAVSPTSTTASTTATAKGSPSTTTTTATATTATAARDRAVSTITVALVDPSRPTVSRGRQLSATRSLPTTVVYPTSGGPFPLVVFAHGFQLGPSHYEHIMRAIAAGGYVVAAPSFPLADAAVAGGNVDRGDIPNQSGDLSFVISQLAAGPAAGGPLAGKIDATSVGAVGHSDGADTVLDLGYYPGRMDGRVMAVAAVSPDAMTGPGGSVGAAPLLISHGDRDTVVPYSNATTVFGQVQARRFLLTLLGGDHLGPAQGQAPWAAVLDRAILELLDRFVAGRTADEEALVAGGTVPGVASVAVGG